MDVNELIEIISLGETSKVQFKETFDNADKIASELIALANSKGGIIVFGVRDKTGEIAGLTYAELQKINNAAATIASDSIKPALYITTEAISVNNETENNEAQKKAVLILSVDEGVNKPYKDRNGTIWLKQGADKRKLTDNHEIMRLFQQSSNLSADEMPIHETSIKDVDERLFSEYFKKAYGCGYEEKHLSFEAALRAKKVLRDDKITLAGLLFFGKEPQLWKPTFTIKTVWFYGNEISGCEYRNKPEDLFGTIPEIYKQCLLFLKGSLRHMQNGQGFNSIGVLEISEIALQEVLQNALIHRNYYKNAPVRVLVFDNRIEIISPGSLPNSLTVEEAKFGNVAIRNNQLATFGIFTLPYSGLGSGLQRAFENQPDIELINDVEGEQFIVKIPRPG